ncbi:hypothetical protein [Breoghania sp.]|uniref:hypothetical protein n=1 Tax=Breoghania sp. TaxID=2065378 RepID=UPI002633C77C|nr:hypothetical protein [Breoghania sp.]MDJ0931483.1 hypothetical protein [Breoghania sp.]
MRRLRFTGARSISRPPWAFACSEDAAELLKFADNTLYQAKQRERGRHCYFNALLRDGMERRGSIADTLREALEIGEIGITL